jgi:hypothetical protein
MAQSSVHGPRKARRLTCANKSSDEAGGFPTCVGQDQRDAEDERDTVTKKFTEPRKGGASRAVLRSREITTTRSSAVSERSVVKNQAIRSVVMKRRGTPTQHAEKDQAAKGPRRKAGDTSETD